MKKLLALFCLVALAACTRAQDPKILKLPIPHYRICKADSSFVTEANLTKGKPVMFIYFAPDCPHCQHLMKEMQEKMNEFKNIQIVMICATRTVYPYLGMLKNFSRDYDLPKYKNITMGSEFPKLDVATYFHVLTTPFVAVYDKDGKMVQYFDKPPKVEEVAAAVKKV
jgi:thiol-disulfide isomerase/thioredoxin